MKDTKIGVILSTTREERSSDKVGEWVLSKANELTDAKFEIVDLRDYPMSFYGDGKSKEIAKKFNEKLRELDGYVFVVAEYNHSIPGVLKSALDWVYDAMANKAAGIVSYGAVGGARAAEHLRLILGQLQVADVSRQVLLSTFLDFNKDKELVPMDLQNKAISELFSQLLQWTKGLKTIR